MIKNPNKAQMKKSLCHTCHWKDEKEMLCHAIEPQKVIDVAIDSVSDCAYIPNSYWERITQERKDELLRCVKERSKKFS